MALHFFNSFKYSQMIIRNILHLKILCRIMVMNINTMTTEMVEMVEITKMAKTMMIMNTVVCN